MNKMKKNDNDDFEILRQISKKPDSTQRELSKQLNFSIGKLNYCLKELQKKRPYKNKKTLKKIKRNLIIFICSHPKVSLRKQYLL